MKVYLVFCEKVFGICESVFGICAGLFWKERGPAECSGVPPMQSSDKEYCFRVTLEPPTTNCQIFWKTKPFQSATYYWVKQT